MVNPEIFEGLRIALERGETLKEAMLSFYTAGYTKPEIEDSARYLVEFLQKNASAQETKSVEQKKGGFFSFFKKKDSQSQLPQKLIPPKKNLFSQNTKKPEDLEMQDFSQRIADIKLPISKNKEPPAKNVNNQEQKITHSQPVSQSKNALITNIPSDFNPNFKENENLNPVFGSFNSNPNVLINSSAQSKVSQKQLPNNSVTPSSYRNNPSGPVNLIPSNTSLTIANGAVASPKLLTPKNFSNPQLKNKDNPTYQFPQFQSQVSSFKPLPRSFPGVKPKVTQIISRYETPGASPKKGLIISLVIILIILVVLLGSLLLFKNEFLDFFSNLF